MEVPISVNNDTNVSATADNDNTTNINTNCNDNDTTKDKSEVPKLRYEVFEGANLFLCNGRIMLGAKSYHLVLSSLLILMTWIGYTIGVIPFLHSPLLLKISWTMCCINMTLLVATATTDAGIVPRSKFIDVNAMIPLSIQNNLKNKYTYCNICNIYRPHRSKHCRHCDNCVDTFDHHCPV